MIKKKIKKILIFFVGENIFYEIKAKVGFLIQLHNHNPFLNLVYSIIKNKNKSNLGNYIFFFSLPKSGNSGITTSLIKNSNKYHADMSRLEYGKRTSDYGYLSDHKKIIKKYIQMGNFVLNGHYWINQQDIEFLKKNNIKIEEISNILINQGPGVFSGIRSSISTVKALSLSNNINIYGFNSNQVEKKNYNKVLDLFKKGALIKNIIKPHY